jgi:type VI secretion system secreted protein VgrG
MGGDASAKECLHTFVCRRRSLPAGVRLQDYDYGKPKLDVSGTAPVSKRGAGEINMHGARFFTPNDGKRLAQIRAEEMLAREVVFTGSGNAFHLRAGYTFALQDHPWPSFDAKYLATEADHYGNQAASTPELKAMTGLDRDEVYRVDVTAIPATVQFRAETRTTWPRIYGTEHGVVDGEADHDYAQLDEQGRYAVRFAFDESDLGAGKASTRVRMMQPHGGDVEGWHFPLRKGTEVLFTFLGGDPDRPVIAGVVPNAHNPSAVTSGNHTKNVIQTGGRNRLEIEDKEGQQRITLSTPHQNSYIRMGAPNADHTMIIKTSGPTLLDAGGNWDVEVKGMLSEYVKGPVEERYDANQTTKIATGRNETIFGGGMNHTITGGWKQIVIGDSSQNIVGAYAHTVSAGVTAKYGSMNLTCGDVVEECGPIVTGCSTYALTARGKVNVNASDVLINGAQVQVKSGGYKGISGPSLEGYTSKNAFGAQKAETCGLNIAVNTVKMEMTNGAFARVGIKLDSTGFKVEHTGFKARLGPEAQNGTFSFTNVGMSILTCGFAKVG